MVNVVESAGFGSTKPEEAFTKPFGMYEFFELRLPARNDEPSKTLYRRFVSGGDLLSRLQEEIVQTPSSNVAFTWRGIRRPNDLDHAIQGSELIIFQVAPFEVLAYRREFSYYYFDSNTRDFRVPWSRGCPYSNGRNAAKIFIESILISVK